LSNNEFLEIPAPVLLQKFEEVATSLCHYGLCISHYSKHHSNIEILLNTSQEQLVWRPSEKHDEHVFAVRFPHYAPLFNILETYLVQNIPGEFWLEEQTLNFHQNEELMKQLHEVREQLTSLVEEKWFNIMKGTSDRDSFVDTLFWLLEEWCLVHRIYFGLPYQGTCEYKFDKVLQITQQQWNQLSHTLQTTKAKSGAKIKIMVNVS
jgi:hypothetical protein